MRKKGITITNKNVGRIMKRAVKLLKKANYDDIVIYPLDDIHPIFLAAASEIPADALKQGRIGEVADFVYDKRT